MNDLIIKGGLVVDPQNGLCKIMDIAVENGLISEIAPEIFSPAREILNAENKVVVPGIIDMHTHMRTILGHPHAQRMVALAGVTTALDMAGPMTY